MNKKLLALLLAILMVAMSAVAMASGVSGDNAITGTGTEHSFVITKNYNKDTSADDSVVKPAQTFNFTVTAVTDGAPAITVNPYAFTGEKASATSIEQLLTIPTVGTGTNQYPAVPAVYEYTLKETIPTTKTQGITYDESKTYNLKVTVVNNPGADGIPSYDTVISLKLNDAKQTNATFDNTYSAGKLTVSKKLAGNAAVSTDEFVITVSFAAENGKAIAADTITAPEGAIAKGDGTYTVTLGHGETATFTNVPAGATYTVSEDPKVYDADDPTKVLRTYTKSTETGSDGETGSITANATKTVAYVNTLTNEIDTGVSTDTMPYILLMAFVAILAVAFVAKKRSVNE